MAAKICALCSKKTVRYICRRCKLEICVDCYFHHGLCERCAKVIGRTQQRRGKNGISMSTTKI